MNQKDLFGRVLYDYWFDQQPEDMITWTNLTDKEVLPTEYLFRKFDDMPLPEQSALQLSEGKILDVGAGSGTHSLWLQENGLDVTALDFSAYGNKVMLARGLKNVLQTDFFELKSQKYDTILFLMNGVGIVGKAVYTDRLFKKIDELLTEDGQAFIHSSDLKYLYETTGGYDMPKEGYYGDLQFFVSYKGDIESFEWTYIDEQTLSAFARQNGFDAYIVAESEYGDFLLRVSRKK